MFCCYNFHRCIKYYSWYWKINAIYILIILLLCSLYKRHKFKYILFISQTMCFGQQSIMKNTFKRAYGTFIWRFKASCSLSSKRHCAQGRYLLKVDWLYVLRVFQLLILTDNWIWRILPRKRSLGLGLYSYNVGIQPTGCIYRKSAHKPNYVNCLILRA